MRVEGRKPRLTPLVEDETRRLTQIEAWLLEAVQEDPTLLADLETRRQAILRCRAPQGEIPPGVRVPPDKVLVRSNGEAQIATTLHLAEIPYRYEAEFPVPEEQRSKEGKRYFPDFYLPDQPESWGNEHGPTGAHVPEAASDRDVDQPRRRRASRGQAFGRCPRVRQLEPVAWKVVHFVVVFVHGDFGASLRPIDPGINAPWQTQPLRAHQAHWARLDPSSISARRSAMI